MIFRASIDGRPTFAYTINLSNTTSTELIDIRVTKSGEREFVKWLEWNETTDGHVTETSINKEKTFGPLLRLAANVTTDR